MSSRAAFQFLHAADFALDAPVFGVADLPAPLRDVLLDARYLAARRVFDTAIEARVDFVVLAGNILGAGYGVRAASFLAEQCARLDQASIPVYWVEQAVSDGVAWPRFVLWPGNVFCADTNFGQVWDVQRAGQRLARLIACRDDAAGRTEAAHRSDDAADVFKIRVVPGSDLNTPPQASADYWALGGEPVARAVPGTGGRARYCGQPQGMNPGDVGPRGCQLVTVEADGSVGHQFVETNAVRWYAESISVDPGTDRLTFRTAVENRYRRIAGETSARLAIVHWEVTGHGTLMNSLHREAAAGELLAELRRLAPETPAIWSLSVETTVDSAAGRELAADEHPLAAVMAQLEQLDADDPRLHRVLDEVAEYFGENPTVPEPKFLDRLRQRTRTEVLRRSGDPESVSP